MIILTVRTENPEAEIGLYKDTEKLGYIKWQADKQLAETIHKKIDEMLLRNKLSWEDIGGVIGFSGPGSFTGLRIGISVVNALALSLDIPVVGTSGQTWIKNGIDILSNGRGNKEIIPEYGAQPHITEQKK